MLTSFYFFGFFRPLVIDSCFQAMVYWFSTGGA